MLYYFGKFVVGPFAYLLFRPKVIGIKNLNRRGKVIYVCNHFSLADPVLLALVCPRIIRFMARANLFSSKIGNLFFKSMLVFPVESGTADRKSIKKAIDTLAKGQAFGIFPEGHRSATGELDALEKGAAFIALRCDAPIVPCYIDPNSIKRVKIRMAVGEPIIAKEVAARNKTVKPAEAVTDALTDSMLSLRELVEAMK
ncbi:MAG: lysophospholipid acyltransferase family protein [Clostridia bacterium]|nr:lysophospholipid acyltransferase family protein [Clostridia bacterium]